MKKLNWEFAPTGGGPDDGINNPLIQPFVGDYYYYLAREIIQNSIDAVRDNKEKAKVEFKLEHLESKKFPDRKELLNIYQECKKYDGNSIDEDAQTFLDEAIDVLSADKIPVLRCSDYNTQGLTGGDQEKQKSWYKLVKSRGSSSKQAGEGGSFGIGKGAPFAASNLRVVFYSTKNLGGEYIFQGIAEIVSFEKNNKVRRGSGSFGNKSYSSIREKEQIPKVFRRDKIGLDVYIAGFKLSSNWKVQLAKSVLRNFWYAVYKEELEVSIGHIQINKDNLEKLLSDLFHDESPKGEKEPRGNPLYYYKSIKLGQKFEDKLENLGHVEFHFYEMDKKLNYVAMLRKPHMTVYSRLYHFPAPYAGVFICEGNVGNKFLRKMEPPAHDKWDPERDKEAGKKIARELHNWVRDCLKSMQKKKSSGTLSIPKLHKYLPFDDGDSSGTGNGQTQYSGEEGEEETSKLIQKEEEYDEESIVSPYQVSVLNEPATGMGKKGSVKREGDGKVDDETVKAPGGGKGKNKAITSEELTSRSFVIDQDKNHMTYKVILKSKKELSCNIAIKAVGDEGDEKITLSNAKDQFGKPLVTKSNQVKDIQLKKGTKNLTVSIKSNIKFALRLQAYEV